VYILDLFVKLIYIYVFWSLLYKLYIFFDLEKFLNLDWINILTGLKFFNFLIEDDVSDDNLVDENFFFTSIFLDQNYLFDKSLIFLINKIFFLISNLNFKLINILSIDSYIIWCDDGSNNKNVELIKSTKSGIIQDKSINDKNNIDLSNIDKFKSLMREEKGEFKGKILLTSENLKIAILNSYNIMNKEFLSHKSLNNEQRAIHWGDLFFWLKKSSLVDNSNIEIISNYFQDQNYREFYKSIPRFINYNKYLLPVINNHNIYLPDDSLDWYGKDLTGSLINKENFILMKELRSNLNIEHNAQLNFDFVPLHFFLNKDWLPVLSEPIIKIKLDNNFNLNNNEDIGTDIFEKYVFITSLSDLSKKVLFEKQQIDESNNNIIKNINLNNCLNKTQLDVINKYFYIWFIEMDIFSFINLNILFKYHIPLNKITLGDFMYSKHLSVIEYLEELDMLAKALIWYEHNFGINKSSLSEEILNEYRDIFHRFWFNQIIQFNKFSDLNKNYIKPNMYDLNIVYLELLENTLYAQWKIIESQWTINTVNNYLQSLNNLEDKDPSNIKINFIDFYNNLFNLYRTNILFKYKDIYELRRIYIVDNYNLHTPVNCTDIFRIYLLTFHLIKGLKPIYKLNEKNFNDN
jgi:hypothetical protein